MVSVLEIIGIASVALFFFKILSALWLWVIRPATNLALYGASFKDPSKRHWAVVTGASDGIGLGLAHQLAKSGFNVHLVSRTESKLQSIVQDLKKKYSVEASYHAIDVSSPSAAQDVFESAKNIRNVSILVNNVGVNVDIPVNVAETTFEEIDSIVTVNVTFTVKLTKLFLPLLKTSSSKRKAIMNLGSITGVMPSPLLATYGGSKAFQDQFSKCLAAEVRKDKIDVISLTPYYVVSSMSGFKKASLTVITPERFAADSLRVLGAADSLSPNIVHALLQFGIVNLMPQKFVGEMVFDQVKKMRNRLLRKKMSTSPTKSTSKSD